MRGKNKIIFSFFLAIFLSFSIAVRSYAAAFVPSLPFVPPAEVQILDMIHNIYGLTTPQIENSQKRLETYWNAYRAIMGSSFNAFQADLEEVISNTKTSNTIFIGSTLNQQLVKIMKQVKTNGYEYSESGEITPPPVTLAEVKQWFRSKGYENIDSVINELYNYNNRITNKAYVIIRPNNTLSGTQSVSFMACQFSNAGWYIEPYNGNTWCYQGTSGNRIYYSYVNSYGSYNFDSKTYTKRDGSTSTSGAGIIMGLTFPTTSTVITSLDSDVETKSVVALDSAVSDALDNEDMIPITADTVLDNGVVDDTKPVIVKMPITWPTPADDVSDLSGVLDDIGVVPVSENPAQTIEQLKEEANVKYGNTGDYALNLTNLFPFCIPFDIGYAISIFAADPEAPSFDWEFPVGYQDGEITYQTFNVDLSAFDSVALVLRKGLDILFIIGLGMITRDKFLRG